ncbi:MAG: hypothetical protein CL866_08340 [Cycloclasticus sp.]|nr:hypothetical protein [Cycloclasticus sp.]MBG96853.1 hypothetical protein [Cycloclasticus sp.]HAI97448.1 hypothetical protein [Methylococcaceae bacterium]|tara:strand:- start:1054 stop:2301 length:1248 start_codon:yes stop_codon:yes gene_type:complete
MSNLTAVELQAKDRPFTQLAERILDGEYFMIRNCLPQLELLDTLTNASYQGILETVGKEKADEVMENGFDKIHQYITPEDIPRVTDAAYEFIEPKTLEFLKKFVSNIIGKTDRFYFERKANVRFHIPHDIAAPYLAKYQQFSHKRGDGKITPHRAHRDDWVDCPSNLINIWIAVGPVRKGNGLTLYPETYRSNLKNDGPYIASDENPGLATTFNMEPGDVILFHGSHVHGSEINVTDTTRHVISFRIALDKPIYSYGHHHHYAWSPLAGGIFDMFAEIPQNMAWSYVKYKIFQANRKLKGLIGIKPIKSRPKTQVDHTLKKPIPLSDLKPGVILPWSTSICVTREESGNILAFSRHCPHEGADLAYGVISDNQVKCPWHNLSINPSTGETACQSLNHLKTYPTEINNNEVTVIEN